MTYMYIDGHLDIAFNGHCIGYDLRQELKKLRAEGIALHNPELLVSLPALRAGGVGIAFATIFTLAASAYRSKDDSLAISHYHNAAEAHRQGLEQLHFYQAWEEAGHIRIIRNQRELASHQQQWQEDKKLGIILLMEGADPIRTVDELEFWWREGVRIVGPAWQATRYAGGTHQPAGLSAAGKELIAALRTLGMMVDVSHLAEQSFWDCLEFYEAKAQPLLASHSNARAITPTDRHLSDAMLQALAQREAIVGVVMANTFLRGDRHKHSRKDSVTVSDVGKQAAYLAQFLGWQGVAIGTDFDGGFGYSRVPAEIDSIADFSVLARAIPEEARAGFLGANWLRFLQQHLPQ